MSKGIVIFAIGHPYYGRMAHNLAFSIKAVAPETEVAVVHAGHALNHLDEHNREVFDHVIPFEEDIVPGALCKLYAGRYSPFNETIVIDSDTLWLPKKTPAELFAEVEGSKFTAITEGTETELHPNYPQWANADEIRQHYQLKAELLQWRSEVFYFDEDGSAILDRALEITREAKITKVLLFGGQWPDELGIGIAAAEAGVTPHVFKWNPTYWHSFRGGAVPPLAEISKNFYLISFGSNSISAGSKGLHNQIMMHAAGKLLRPYIFPITPKKTWNPARAKM